MNILINNFIEYLLSFGILSKDLICRFNAMNSTRDEKKSLIDDFIDQMSKSLLNYFNSLSTEQKYFLTENIVKQFLIKNNSIKLEKLKDVIFKISLKKKLDIKTLFERWKKKINSNTNINTNTNTIQSKKYFNDEKTKKNLSTDHLLNSNNSKKSNKKQKITIPKCETDNKSIIEFIPYKNKIYFNYKKDKTQYHPLKENFQERQNSLLKRKKEHIKNLNFGNELHLSNSCTFIPSINENTNQLTNSLSYTSSFIRLYYDNHYRINTYMINQKQEEERIKFEANRNVFKNLDLEKIEKLYNDYKEKELLKKNLRIKYDEENGITYKPFIRHGKYYNKINSTFKKKKNTLENYDNDYNNDNMSTNKNSNNENKNKKSIKSSKNRKNSKKYNSIEVFTRLSDENNETTSKKLKTIKNVKKIIKFVKE